MSYKVFAHFWLGCLYILDIRSLLIKSFVNIFSHSTDCLFVFFMVSFAVQKLLSLIRSHLFIFAFISMTLEGGSGSCCDLCQRVFWLFSFRSFIVSDLTFRSLIHFEFIFVYGVRKSIQYKKVVQFHSFSYSYLVFLTLFIEKTVFSHIFLIPLL